MKKLIPIVVILAPFVAAGVFIWREAQTPSEAGQQASDAKEHPHVETSAIEKVLHPQHHGKPGKMGKNTIQKAEAELKKEGKKYMKDELKEEKQEPNN